MDLSPHPKIADLLVMEKQARFYSLLELWHTTSWDQENLLFRKHKNIIYKNNWDIKNINK